MLVYQSLGFTFAMAGGIKHDASAGAETHRRRVHPDWVRGCVKQGFSRLVVFSLELMFIVKECSPDEIAMIEIRYLTAPDFPSPVGKLPPLPENHEVIFSLVGGWLAWLHWKPKLLCLPCQSFLGSRSGSLTEPWNAVFLEEICNRLPEGGVFVEGDVVGRTKLTLALIGVELRHSPRHQSARRTRSSSALA
jgi:hypothetical protein